MHSIVKGVIAGFAATVVLSLLMAMKSAMGLMPELDIISMLSSMMNTSVAMGWLAHFMIGSVILGGLFALLVGHLPGASVVRKGAFFGFCAWLLMMIAVMPMADAGVFGMKFGFAAPLMTLVLHLIFGVVLGATYGALQRR